MDFLSHPLFVGNAVPLKNPGPFIDPLDSSELFSLIQIIQNLKWFEVS
jgi:hypothetical protein